MRINYDLTGLWFFKQDPDDLGIEQQWYNEENYPYLEDKIIASVPGCWNVLDITNEEVREYKGVGWYFKFFRLPIQFNGLKSMIKFEGVNQETTVFLDGKKIGEHFGGFTPFSFDVTGLYPEDIHFLAVQVKSHSGCGGIHQNVYLEFFGSIFMEEYKISQKIEWSGNNPRLVKLSIKTYFKNTTDSDWEGRIYHYIQKDKTELINFDRDFNIQKQNTRLLNDTIQLEDPTLWCPEDPVLYELITIVRDKDENIIEIKETSIGFREFIIEDDQFILNKQPLLIKSMDKEFVDENFGYSIPNLKIINELNNLKRQKVNLIHILNHPTNNFVLNMMDHLGFLVIEEMKLENVTNAQKTQIIKDMINRDQYHTSIISWNEIRAEDPDRNLNIEELTHITKNSD